MKDKLYSTSDESNQQLSITALRTSPYHPQTDGLVERFYQTLKSMVRKFVMDQGQDWDKWLPWSCLHTGKYLRPRPDSPPLSPCRLLSRETRYSTIEKECLALKWSMEALRYYLLWREFDLKTDHRALTWIHSVKDHNALVKRWYLALQPCPTFQVQHCPGRQNLVADYLSRL